MTRLGIEESKVLKAGAWAGEKIGRVLLTIAGNQPGGVGLLLTLEGLIMGIRGKELLWRALSAAKLPKLEVFDFKNLRRRAEEQMTLVQAEQIRSARRSLADKSLWQGGQLAELKRDDTARAHVREKLSGSAAAYSAT